MSGSPTTGVLFQIKKSSKLRYKYEVRRLKRQKEHIRRKKALTRCNMSEFWRQVRAATKKSRSSVPMVEHGPSNISSSKLQSILNSGTSDARDALLTPSDIDCISISSDCVAEAF